jgi:hypothetical protein
MSGMVPTAEKTPCGGIAFGVTFAIIAMTLWLLWNRRSQP